MGRILIYGKEGWGHTAAARSKLTDAIYYDVKKDDAKLEEMLNLSKGIRRVPVIVKENGEIQIGFDGGTWGV